MLFNLFMSLFYKQILRIYIRISSTTEKNLTYSGFFMQLKYLMFGSLVLF